MTNEELAKMAQEQMSAPTGSLADFQSTMLASFKKNGLKIQNPEFYKFTALSSFVETLNYSAQPNSSIDISQHKNDSFIDLVFLDGSLKTTLPNIPGLKIQRMQDVFDQFTYLFKTENALSEIHHSLIQNGAVIEVASKAEIPHPIRVVNLVSKSSLNPSTIVIKAGTFSKVSFVEETIEQNAGRFSLGETYILTESGAHVEHVQISAAGNSDLTHTSTKSIVAKEGTYRSVYLNLSGKLNRQNLEIELTAPGSHGESYALYLTNGPEHSDINTVIHHKAADTTSDQVAKGILDGESKGIFTGRIHIHPHAQRVSSGQLNKNLLLSKKAQAHSQPQLEIFADDVKCSHGSTTGQLSDDEVFYFEARGIPQDKARTLLALGFGLEIVQKIQNKELQHYAELKVKTALSSKFKIGTSL